MRISCAVSLRTIACSVALLLFWMSLLQRPTVGGTRPAS